MYYPGESAFSIITNFLPWADYEMDYESHRENSFCDTPKGAHASAAFYSLIESAKSASLEPYWYIRCVLQKLPEIEENSNWNIILPENITPENSIPLFLAGGVYGSLTLMFMNCDGTKVIYQPMNMDEDLKLIVDLLGPEVKKMYFPIP